MRLRLIHSYTAILVASSILFFALSGAMQLFDLHEPHGRYRPPALIEKLGELHKNQIFAVGCRDTSPGRVLLKRSEPSFLHRIDKAMKLMFLLLAAVSAVPAVASAQSIVRVVPPGEPVASVVDIPAGSRIAYIGGQSAASRGVAHFGDTEVQTVATLSRIRDILKTRGMTMGNIVMLNIYLLADPHTRKPDRDGMSAGFRQFFGTRDQPNLPTRTVLQVDGMDDGSLVVIDAHAVLAPQDLGRPAGR